MWIFFKCLYAVYFKVTDYGVPNIDGLRNIFACGHIAHVISDNDLLDSLLPYTR